MYRIVYDVQDDSVFAGHSIGLIFTGFAIFWTAFWYVLHRYVRGMPPEQRRNAWKGGVAGCILIAAGLIILTGTTIPAIRDQLRCRKWLLTGEHQTATGGVSDFRRDAGKNAARRFRVGETDFAYWAINSPIAGFRGDFTTPDATQLKLRDGLSLRIAHRDSRILRIEVAEGS